MSKVGLILEGLNKIHTVEECEEPNIEEMATSDEDLKGFFKDGPVKVVKRDGKMMHMQRYINAGGIVKYKTL